MKRIAILGSTGSIGTSALKVARDIPDRMEIVGLAAGTSVEALARQAREFNVRNVCIYDPSGAAGLAASLPGAQVETGDRRRGPRRIGSPVPPGAAPGGGHGINLHRGNRRAQTRSGRH